MTIRHADGYVASGYEPVAEQLGRFVAEDRAYSAAFCAYVDGRAVVDIWAGAEADGHGIQGVFSSTKGCAAMCIGMLVDRGLVDLDDRVARYWPEFDAGGKGAVTV